MSLVLMAEALKARAGGPVRKLVLIKLADNANDDGVCWPSYQHIADQCEISRRSVIAHVAALCECGLLRKVSRVGPMGTRSNSYELLLSGKNGRAPANQGGESSSPGGEKCSLGGENCSLGGGENSSPRICHSFEPVKEPIKEPKDHLSRKRDDEVSAVIDHLNGVTGARYRASTASHAKNITGRLSEGHTVSDLIAVIDFKACEWASNPAMTQYLRPQTLFGPDKFVSYLAAARTKQSDPLAGLSAISRKNVQNLAGGW